MFRSRRQNFRPKLDLISESELRKRNSDCNGEQRQETTNPTKSTNAEGDCPNACMPAVNTEISSDPLTATTSHHPPVLK